MSTKNEFAEHSQMSKEGVLDIKKIYDIPEERFDTKPFNFKPLSLNIGNMNTLTIISTAVFMGIGILCGNYWGVTGYINFMIYIALVISVYVVVMALKLRNAMRMPDMLADGLDTGTLKVTGQNIKANDPNTKKFLSHFALIVGVLYYRSIYDFYVSSVESSASSLSVIALFLVVLGFITSNYVVIGLATYYVLMRFFGEYVRLAYIRLCIEYAERFNRNLKERVVQQTNNIA